MKRLNEDGLTLMEIIIGIAISAVIFVMLLAILRLGQSSEKRGTEHLELSQRVRILGDRLSWLMRGAYPYTVKEEDETKLYFQGTDSDLGFVTTSVDSFSESPADLGGLKWVRISEGEEGLKVFENVYFLEDISEGGEEYTLDPSVRKISFEYFDPGGEDEEGSWVDEWDGSDRDYLPAAVKITLTLLHKEREFQMPPVVATLRTGTQLGGSREKLSEQSQQGMLAHP